jgi:hypothetical protein
MNLDTVMQLLRYVLLAGGGFAVGRGWITNAQVELIGGFAAVVIPAAWGLYVKWNTSPVKDTVILSKNVPSINSATGSTEPAPTNRRP